MCAYTAHSVVSEIYPWTSFNFHLISFSFSCILCVLFSALILKYKFSLAIEVVFSFWFIKTFHLHVSSCGYMQDMLGTVGVCADVCAYVTVSVSGAVSGPLSA